MNDTTALKRTLGLFKLDEIDRDIFSWTGRNVGYKRIFGGQVMACLLYTSPSPRDRTRSRMPSSA